MIQFRGWTISGRNKIYAVLSTGGKQYRVSENQVLDVEKIVGDEGAKVEITDVLCIEDGEKVVIGQPNIEGAKVMATIVSQSKHRKIIVFKYKSKIRYRRKKGHRQNFTRLNIDQIVA